MFKRRHNKKTDYRQRLALLKSGIPRLVIRRTNNTILIQVVQYDASGDKTIATAHSKELAAFGWKGHKGNMPSAYLTGLLAGKKAVSKGIKSAIADFGLQYTKKGSTLYAAVKGAADAGIKVPVGDAFPAESRIKGEHIAEYAKMLKAKDKTTYQKRFSAVIKKGFNPEEITKLFEDVKEQMVKKSL